MNKSICPISRRTVRPLYGNFLFLRILITANHHSQKSCCGKISSSTDTNPSARDAWDQKEKGVLQNQNFTTRRTRNDGFECKFRRNLLQYLMFLPCKSQNASLVRAGKSNLAELLQVCNSPYFQKTWRKGKRENACVIPFGYRRLRAAAWAAVPRCSG